MFEMSDKRLFGANRLQYDMVVEQVEVTNSSATWFAWHNLCDVAFVGICRGDINVPLQAISNLEQLLEVVEKTLGNKYWQEKRRLTETRELLLKGENLYALYWLGQLRFVVAGIQKSLKEVGEP